MLITTPQRGTYHVSAGIDSYYEYLLKQWLQSNRTATRYRDQYLLAVHGIASTLVSRNHNFTVLGSTGEGYESEMHHLSCFIPGMLALGYHNGLPRWHLTLAEHLMRTCYYMVVSQATGVGPETAYFDDKQLYTVNSQNVLRPEVAESLFVLYAVTRDTTYQDWGWELFQGYERSSRVCSGFSGLYDTQSTNFLYRIDRMESGFLSGTLKYLYLLFADVGKTFLDDWLFNCHGHLLKKQALPSAVFY